MFATIQSAAPGACLNSVGEGFDVQRISRADAVGSVLVDLFLPDSQGIETFDQIFRVAPQIPILVLSAVQDEDIAKLAVQHGAQDYLLKTRLDGYLLPKALDSMVERAANAEALFEEKERAQVTLNSIGDAVMSTDVWGRVTYLNMVAERLTGWSREEAAGHPLENVFRIIDATTREVIQNPMTLAIRENKTVGLTPNCINDSLGHEIGDRLLQSVAARLHACVRSSDTVSRQGGDEFVVLLSEVKHVQDAAVIAEKILLTLRTAHRIDQHDLHLTVSIGIASRAVSMGKATISVSRWLPRKSPKYWGAVWWAPRLPEGRTMDERPRRKWAASEAQSFGRGGVSAVSRATGMSIDGAYKQRRANTSNRCRSRVRGRSCRSARTTSAAMYRRSTCTYPQRGKPLHALYVSV
jgi:PAS domain S-box-containing protein